MGFDPVTEDDLEPLPKGFTTVGEGDLAPAESESHFFPRSFSEAAQQAKDIGLDIYHGARRANDFATNLIAHPVDTAKQIGANPGASYRQAMRGVNSNIPFANRAVEAIGGPPAASPEDAAAAPRGLSDAAGFAALPGVGKMIGGVAAKGIEAGGAALDAAGRAAVREAAKAPGTSRVFKAAQSAGEAAGTVVGGHAAGGVGALTGKVLGKQAGETVGKLGDRLVGALAKRYSAAAARAVPAVEAAEIEPIPVPDNPQLVPLPEAPPPRLAPLIPEGPTLPNAVPEGTFGTKPPHLDDITGEPVTQAGQGGFLPEEAATKAAPKGNVAPLEKEGQDVLAELAKLKAQGMTKAPPELAARVKALTEKLNGPPRSFATDVVNTAKLVKMAKSGAKAPAIRKAAAEMGLPDDIVRRVLEKPPLGHEAAPGE